MQDWQKKIFDGMTMIKEGCEEQSNECRGCPFESICIDIQDDYGEPQSWDVLNPDTAKYKSYKVVLTYSYTIVGAESEKEALKQAVEEIGRSGDKTYLKKEITLIEE